MHLSTRGRYAVMAMLDLAHMTAQSDRPVTLAQIAEQQQISLSYLEQLFARLRKAGVVDSVRGPGGGYSISRDLGAVTLLEIVNAVEEELDVTRCGKMHDPRGPADGKGCVYGTKCNAHDVWAALGRTVEQFLASVTLRAVLDGELAPATAAELGVMPVGSVKVKINA